MSHLTVRPNVWDNFQYEHVRKSYLQRRLLLLFNHFYLSIFKSNRIRSFLPLNYTTLPTFLAFLSSSVHYLGSFGSFMFKLYLFNSKFPSSVCIITKEDSTKRSLPEVFPFAPISWSTRSYKQTISPFRKYFQNIANLHLL